MGGHRSFTQILVMNSAKRPTMKNFVMRLSDFSCGSVFLTSICIGGIVIFSSLMVSAEMPSVPCRDGGGKPAHAGPKHGGSGMGRNFKALDEDGDGFLSFEEFSKSERLSRMDEKKRRKLFDYLDQKKDGKLHTRELRPHPPYWVVALRKEFRRWDADQSGGLDFEEFSKVPQISKMGERERKKMFKRMDRNKDQLIQRAEIKGHGGPGSRKGCPKIDFKKYDTNQSGGLNFEEYSKIPWLGRIPEDRRKMLFQKLDRDHDGEISAKEVKATWAARHKHGPPPHARPHRGSGTRKKSSDDGSNPPHGKGSGSMD